MDRNTFLKHVDEAFDAEIQRVSTVEYNSNEICRHFFDKVRERLKVLIAPRYKRLPPQEPVATAGTGNRDDQTDYEHPAFASISAHRISGGAVLFGSDFRHQHYVTVKIGPSSLRRSLSNDWHHASNRPYIEVNLSEAQWAHFVSSMNTGSGTQCTLTDLMGDTVPGLVDPVDRRQQFSVESNERVLRSIRDLDAAAEAIKASGLSQKKQAEVLSKIDGARRNIGVNQQFVADQFAEHIEKTVEHAKVEVDGYIAGATRQLGLQAMQLSGVEAKAFKLAFPGVPGALE